MKKLIPFIVVILAVASIPGCDLFKTSKYNGTPMTADEVVAQAKLDASKEQAKAKADADRMNQALKAEADENATKVAKRTAAFNAAVSTLDAETRIKLASLQAEYEIETADATRRIARMQADTETAIRQVSDRTQQRLDEIAAKSTLAQSDIESKAAFAEWGTGALNQVGGLFPGGGIVTGLLTGLVGIGVGRAGRKKAEDAAWDDGHKAADTAAEKRDAAWTEAQLSLLKLMTPPPAAPPTT